MAFATWDNRAGYYVYLYPTSDITAGWTTIYPTSPTTHYDKVDETSTDSDSTYIATGTNGKVDKYGLTFPYAHNYNKCTIAAIQVTFTIRRSGGTGNAGVTPFLYLNGSQQNGATQNNNTSTYQTYTQAITRPGGGSWTFADLANLQVGVTSNNGSLTTVRCTKLTVLVTFFDLPSPDTLRCDDKNNPKTVWPVMKSTYHTDVVASAMFMRIFVTDTVNGSTGNIHDGWHRITGIADNSIGSYEYAGATALTSPKKYYWKTQFVSTAFWGFCSETETAFYGTQWSDTSYFSTVDALPRYDDWANEDYVFRRKLTWADNHRAIPLSYVQRFKFQTGNRTKIATNGDFNEAVQASGGYQIEYANGKTHVVYLSEYSSSYSANGSLGTYIVTFDHYTQRWGTPYSIDQAYTTFDSHNFPTLCVDNQGYIHVFYGSHGVPVYYARSEEPNESGSLSEDSTAWSLSSLSDLPISYPIGWLEKNSGRIYCNGRGDVSGAENDFSFVYSDDNGSNWSSAYSIIIDTAYNVNWMRYRIYCYGFKYDISNERLHLAYTFNSKRSPYATGDLDLPQGVWYIYSDKDTSYPEYFHSWYYIDGTLAGTTSKRLTGDTTLPVHRNMSKYVVLRDTNYQPFITDMILDGSSNPFILYETKSTVYGAVGGPTRETTLMGARYENSSWNKICISDQVDTKLRVRRGGTPGMTDNQKMMHLFMAANAKRNWHRFPIGDNSFRSSDHIYCASGSDKWAMVDDGPFLTDKDVTYCDVLNTANAFFDIASSLPQNIRIYSAGLFISAKTISATASSMYGHVLYQSSARTMIGSWAVPISNLYTDYEYQWTTIPGTSTAWTPDIINKEIKIGFRGNTTNNARFRVTSFGLKIYAGRLNDDEFCSGDVLELISIDNGRNWQIRDIIRNNGIGIPILNSKHHFTNNTIETIWTSGKDIFYYTNEPYGKTLAGGEDIRLYYNGSEIDRIIDYPNMSSSEVLFRTQTAIEADSAESDAGSYYIYYGNKSCTSFPKSDPHNVFRFFENFESYSSGYSLSKEWRLNEGAAAPSGVCYKSPPSHANKIFSGEKSIHLYMGAYNNYSVGTTLSIAALENAYLEVGCWKENQNLNTAFGILIGNALGNKFGVGFYGDENPLYSACYVDSVWHTSCARMCAAKNMDQLSIQVTNKSDEAGSGKGSAWINNIQIVNETSIGLTDVKTIHLVGDCEAFFDYIRLSNKLERVDTAGYYASATGAIAQYNSNTSPAYVSPDLKCEWLTHRNIERMDVQLRCKYDIEGEDDNHFTMGLWVSTGFNYTATARVAYATCSLVVPAGAGADWHTTNPLIFNNLPSGPKSMKLDLYYIDHVGEWGQCDANFAYIKVYNRALEPQIIIGEEEVQGFYSDATILGSTQYQFTMDGKIGAWWRRLYSKSLIEHMCRKNLENKSLIEYKRSLQSDSKLPSEYSIAINNLDGKLSIEYLNSTDNEQEVPIEYSSLINNLLIKIPTENITSLVTDNRVLIEYNCNRTIYQNIIIEYLQSQLFDSKIPAEYIKNVNLYNKIPVSFKESLNLYNLCNIEYNCNREFYNQLIIDYGLSSWSNFKLPLSNLNSGLFDNKIPIDYSGTFLLSADLKLSIDFIGTLNIDKKIPVSYKNIILAGLYKLPVEFIGSVLIDRKIPFSNLSSQEISQKIILEYLSKFSIDEKSVIEYGVNSYSNFKIPLDYNQTLGLISKIPVDYVGTSVLDIENKIPVDWSSVLTLDEKLNIDYLSSMNLNSKTIIEYLTSYNNVMILPIDYSKSLIATEQVLTEWSGAIILDLYNKMPINWSASINADGLLSIENVASFDNISSKLIIESLSSLLGYQEVVLGFDTRTYSSLKLAVESLNSLSKDSKIVIDWTATPLLLFDIKIPVEWQGEGSSFWGRIIEYKDKNDITYYKVLYSIKPYDSKIDIQKNHKIQQIKKYIPKSHIEDRGDRK